MKETIYIFSIQNLLTTDKWWKNLHARGHEESQEDEIAGIM
jgi:hypothetical protein